jgi:heme-degrading monooxygenase HmoA
MDRRREVPQLEVRAHVIRGTFVILWEFRVRPGLEHTFIEKYGPEGDWVRLFRNSTGFLGTDLLRDEWDRRRFITQDRWASAADYEAFQWRHQAAYEALDRACAPLIETQRRFGVFTGP